MCNAIRIGMNSSEYLVELKKVLTYEIRESVKSGRDVSESFFLDRAIDYLKGMHIHGRDLSGYPMNLLFSGRSVRQGSAVTKIWNEIRPDIEKHVIESIKQFRSKRMVTEIRQLTAQAQINEAMDEAGLKCLIIPQTYRAKVAVKLGSKNKVVFYISYKNTQEDLDRCINSAKQLVALMDSLGKGASIQKMMPYENW